MTPEELQRVTDAFDLGVFLAAARRIEPMPKPPLPYYTIEALLNSEWKVVDERTMRGAALSLARELAEETKVNHHVYVLTRNHQKKHIFTAKPKLDHSVQTGLGRKG